MSAVSTETSYVRKEPLQNEDPMWQIKYEDVDAEEEEYGDLHRL